MNYQKLVFLYSVYTTYSNSIYAKTVTDYIVSSSTYESTGFIGFSFIGLSLKLTLVDSTQNVLYRINVVSRGTFLGPFVQYNYYSAL